MSFIFFTLSSMFSFYSPISLFFQQLIMSDELSHKNLDPVKKYAQPVPLKHGSWRCNYCHKVTNGGVKGAKQHILGGFRNVTQCSLVPPIMREEIKDSMLKKTEIKATTQMMPPPATSYDDYGEEEEAAEVLGNERRQPPVKKQKGLMDMFVCPTLPNVLKGRKDNRINNCGVCDKKLRHIACSAIARWFFDAKLSFNAINYDSFKEALSHQSFMN